jgi:hypothetical protein
MPAACPVILEVVFPDPVITSVEIVRPGPAGAGLPAGMTMVLSDDDTELVVAVGGDEVGRLKLYDA